MQSSVIGSPSSSPRLIGLTGGIASGKSTVARMLAELGAKVIDADQIAREVVAPGTPGLARVALLWPEVVVGGQLDRQALGKKIFAAPKERAALNALLHPLIAEEAARRAQAYGEAGEKVVVYEAALIVENRLDEGMDGLIVVSVPERVQVERLAGRDGLAEEDARARLAAQASLEEKVRRARWVVDNSKSLEHTRDQVKAVWREISRGS